MHQIPITKHLGFILLIIAFVLSIRHDFEFKKAELYTSIVCLELKYTTDSVRSIKNEWKNTNIKDSTLLAHAITGIKWDFLFIIIYSGYLAFYHYQNSSPSNSWAKAAMVAAIAAGILDVFENIGMLHSLNQEYIEPWVVWFTATAAQIKFGLVIFTLGRFLIFGVPEIFCAWLDYVRG